MDRTAVVTKTAKGEEEIQHRSHGLDRNLRYVLIMVDGKATVQELIEEKGAALSDVEGQLRTLAEGGYIDIGGIDMSCTVSSEQDIPALKGQLIAIATELLGADAAKIISKLEAAPDSREGLQDAVNSCKKVVKLLIDEKKAEALMARCSTVLKGL